MEFIIGNIQMPSSSVFSIPTKDNRKVEPSPKQQQPLLAPFLSSSASVGQKRKHQQTEDGNKNVHLHQQQMNRDDKRLRLDQQQTISSSSIGLKKRKSITVSISEHSQASSTTPAAAVNLRIPSTATIRHSMTAESNDPKNRVKNKINELLNSSSTQKPKNNHSADVATNNKRQLPMSQQQGKEVMRGYSAAYHQVVGAQQENTNKLAPVHSLRTTTSNKPTNNDTIDERRFLNAFTTSKALFKTDLEKLTGLSKNKIVQLAAKLCEKTNPSSQRSKLRLKSEITTIKKNSWSDDAAAGNIKSREHRPMIVTTTTTQQQLVKRKRTEDEGDHHPLTNSQIIKKSHKITVPTAISSSIGGYKEDGNNKGWTTGHVRQILSSYYHLGPPLSPISDHHKPQQRVAVSTIAAAVPSATSIRIVTKQQHQFKMAPSNSSSDLVSSIMNDQKKMLTTIKQPNLPSPSAALPYGPVVPVVGVQFSVPFVGGKAKWIEQQRRNEQERRRQLQHQSQSPAVISLLRQVGDGFSSMSPSERRHYIETKFQQLIDNNATDYDVIGNNDSEWD